MNFVKQHFREDEREVTRGNKIAEIYDPEFVEEFTEIFEVLVTHIKNTSKEYWTLMRKLAACEKERDEERRAREQTEELLYEERKNDELKRKLCERECRNRELERRRRELEHRCRELKRVRRR